MDDGTITPRPRRDSRRRRRQAARRRLLLLVVLLVVAAAATALVLGRGGRDDAATAAKGWPSAGLSPEPPPTVWTASRSHPVRVWVGGDSLGGELGWSLGPLLKATRVFRPTSYYKESSGICRWDFFDWGKQMRTVMRTENPDAVVVMMGTNDTQSVWRAGTWIQYGTSAWKTAYGKRVSGMMATMFAGGARRVYWVGMPVMKESWRNSRMKLINKIVRKAAATHPGAEYVDAWGMFVGADGGYDASWRLSDGVHLTVEGQRRLAEAVLRAMKSDWLPDGLRSPTPSPSASPPT